MTLLVRNEVCIDWLTAIISREEVIAADQRDQEDSNPNGCGRHYGLMHVWWNCSQLALVSREIVV